MLHIKDDIDYIPAKTREMQVLYYEVSRDKKHPNIKRYKDPVYGHPKEPEYKMYMKQINKKFNSFDDAVDFLDNLGEDNTLIEVASLIPQVRIHDPLVMPPRFIGSCDDMLDEKNFIFTKKIYTNKELFDTRVAENNKIVGHNFNLHMQVVSKYCTTWF